MQQNKVDTIIKDDDMSTLQKVYDYVAINSSKMCVIPMLQSINSYVWTVISVKLIIKMIA